MSEREHVDKITKTWLTNCPPSDDNFRSRLKHANAATIKLALKDQKITKTARSRMEQRLRALKRVTPF